jgi:hypothetical protein
MYAEIDLRSGRIRSNSLLVDYRSPKEHSGSQYLSDKMFILVHFNT